MELRIVNVRETKVKVMHVVMPINNECCFNESNACTIGLLQFKNFSHQFKKSINNYSPNKVCFNEIDLILLININVYNHLMFILTI